jgi:hypothetical protein
VTDGPEAREIDRLIHETQTEPVPEPAIHPSEIVAVRNLCAQAGLEEEFEEMMYRAFAKHEAAWRAEYPPDDPDILWLEEMKRKYGPVE